MDVKKETKFPRYYDAKEIAEIFNVSVKFIYNEIESGSLKAIKMGVKRLKVPENEIENYIKSHAYIGFDNINRANDLFQKRKYGRKASRT